MIQTHAYTTLPIDDPKPARKANGKFTRLVHAYAGRKNLPHISRQQELELIGLAKDTACQESLGLLIESHMGFIVNIANQAAKNSGMEDYLDDLYNEACEGFIQAVQRFDLKNIRGRLSTYAKFSVAGRCLKFASDNKHIFRYGTNYDEKRAFFGMSKLRTEFFECHGRVLTTSDEDIEAAEALSGIHKRAIKRTLELEGSGVPICMQTVQISDARAAGRGEVELAQKRDGEVIARHAAKSARSMSQRDSDILITLLSQPDEKADGIKDLADKHGVSVERIRQIYRGALTHIRASLAEEGLTSIADFG